MRTRLFWAQFAALVACAGGDFYALSQDLYWRYPLVDMPVHFLGGMWAALAFAYVLTAILKRPCPSLLPIVLASVIIGICWELYEYAFHVAMVTSDFYVYDTAKDLLMDTLGGFAAYGLIRWLRLA
ncbi:MAG TPA: hypothetical protein VFL98_03125 [Candidatus Paceibacterota bacterium]|nr:hypothetical protein [Candidatus Paceibacterota bacterium]